MPDFLTSLLDLVKNSPVGQGVRSSMDAFDQDVSDISQLRMPRQAMRAIGDVVSSYGNAGTGVFLPKVPKYVGFIDDFLKAHPEDKQLWEALKEQPLFKQMSESVLPSGKYDTILGTTLSGGGFGQLGQKINNLRNFVTKIGEEAASQGSDVIKAAKQMRPGVSKLAGYAKPNAVPTVQRYEQMLAGVGDPVTGQVIHSMEKYRPGDHGGLSTIASTIKDFKPEEGFVDPQTFDFFTRQMIEDWIAGKRR